MSVKKLNMSNDFCWNSTNDYIVRKFARNHGTSGNDGVFANTGTFENRHAVANPDIVANGDLRHFRAAANALVRGDFVEVAIVDGHMRANEDITTNLYTRTFYDNRKMVADLATIPNGNFRFRRTRVQKNVGGPKVLICQETKRDSLADHNTAPAFAKNGRDDFWRTGTAFHFKR